MLFVAPMLEVHHNKMNGMRVGGVSPLCIVDKLAIEQLTFPLGR